MPIQAGEQRFEGPPGAAQTCARVRVRCSRTRERASRSAPVAAAFSPPGGARSKRKRRKRGGTTDTGAVVPLRNGATLVPTCSAVNRRLRNLEPSMSFALNDLAVPQRAALCAARRAPVPARLSAAATRDMWGVSDPLCHPLVEVLGLDKGGRSRPRCMSRSSGGTPRVRDTVECAARFERRCAPRSRAPVRTADRFSPELAFI